MWHETAPFSGHDLAGLARHRARPPGADEHTPLIAVSRLRGDLPGVTMLGADDLLEAWPT